MDQNTVMQNFQSLPPEAQKQVVDFISFLQTRYKTTPAKRKTKPGLKLADETFIGIWRDRADMKDSSKWVREAREREWE